MRLLASKRQTLYLGDSLRKKGTGYFSPRSLQLGAYAMITVDNLTKPIVEVLM